VPPVGAKPGENWSTPHGLRARTDAMPRWLTLWYRTPLLDRKARVYMWHHGFWAVPPTLDWTPSSSDPEEAGSSYLSPTLPRSWLGHRVRQFRHRSRRQFGIQWSWWIRIPLYALAAVIGGLMRGRWGAVLCVVASELGLHAISLYSGRKLSRPKVSDLPPTDAP